MAVQFVEIVEGVVHGVVALGFETVVLPRVELVVQVLL